MKLRIILSFIILIVSLALHLPEVRGEATGKRLLIINSYHDGAPWAQDIINPVLSDISKREDFVAPEVVYLSNTLIHNGADFKRMEDGLFERFAGRRPDYLVLVGNFAFTLRHRIQREWGNVPMLLVAQSQEYGDKEFYYTYDENDSVQCGPLRPLKELQGKYNFSLVHIPNLYEQTIDMMKYMFPEMNRLVFIADALYINRHLNHQIKDFMAQKYPDVSYEWLVASDENGKLLQQYLNNRDRNVGILLSTWFFERMTIHGYPQLIAGDAHLIKSTRRTVFGLRYAYFSYGLTGGFFPSPEEFKDDLLDGLRALVSDRNMSQIPFHTVNHSYPIINYEKLMRNKIPESACPPGTHFINKPKTVWEEHYASIIAGGVALLAIMVAAVVLIVSQKRRIELLRIAKEKAMESDKLKMAFLANMSHEIRTPLNAIVGFSTMLTKTSDPKKQSRFVDIINHNNELMLKLIGDVLDTAKIESNSLDVHRETTDVNKVMISAESTVRLRLPKGVALNMVLGEAECEIFTDPDRLNQVLVNLLTNAMKFTKRGNITFGYEINGLEVYFYVRDTGEGIAPENIDKLFTRFTKLNEFVQGTGLGLSISKSIVERLGGKIGAMSDGVGKGSTFWFTLPYSQQ